MDSKWEQMTNASDRLENIEPDRLKLIRQLLSGAQHDPVALSRRALLRPTPRNVEMPLSVVQQRLWSLCQTLPGSPFLNTAFIIRIEGDLDVIVLERSVNEVVQRHEILRTRFTDRDGSCWQVADPDMNVRPTLVDLSHLSLAEGEAGLQRLIKEEKFQPFDLTKGPPLRVQVVQLREREFRIICTAPILVCDESSVEIFVRELVAFYKTDGRGYIHTLAPLRIQYADYSAWQREVSVEPDIERQLSSWCATLRGSSVLEMPARNPWLGVARYDAANESTILSREAALSLRALAQRENVTVFMVLLTGFVVFLHRSTEQNDINVASPIASRNHPDIGGMIGPFANELALRIDCSGNPTFRELLKRVREVFLVAHANSELRFEGLVAATEPSSNWRSSSLFQIQFSSQNGLLDNLAPGDLPITDIEFVRIVTQFNLECHVVDGEHGMKIQMVYNAALYEGQVVTRWLKHYASIIAGTIANPDQRITITPTQAALCKIWGDLLRVRFVGIDEDFFQLGGHSLLVTQVISRVRDFFGVEIPVWNMLEAPTIFALAETIEAAQKSGQGRAHAPVTPRSKF